MTDQELLAAIQADSQAAALAAAGNDAGCAARLGAILPPATAQYISRTALVYFGATRSLRSRFEDAANKAGAFAAIPDAARSLALTYQDILRDQSSPGLSTTDPAVVGTTATGPYVAGSGAAITVPGMLDALVAAGLLNTSGAGGKDDLLAQAPTTPQTISAADVSRAWAQFRPGGLITSG